MNLFDFQLLPYHEKIDTLYEQGVYLGKRKMDDLTVLLYQLDGYYIEIFYKKHRCYVTKVNVFSSTSLLDPYLDQIAVEPFVYTK